MSQREVEKVRKYRPSIRFKFESIRCFPFMTQVNTNIVLLLSLYFISNKDTILVSTCV